MSLNPRARDDGRQPSEHIGAYLERLLDSAAFRTSARRRKLLAYVVERTLAGEGHRLKAFDIALSVLGRDERFDPQNDPIVRIEVGRLRRDLDQYYLADGREDPIRISIPKGHYVPAFEMRDQSERAAEAEPAQPNPQGLGWWAPAHRRHVTIAGSTILVGVLALVVLWLAWREPQRQQAAGPAVVVVPFQELSGGEDSRLLATGLTNGLVIGLMRYDGLQVFAAPAGADSITLPPAAASGAPAYLVTGGVERAPDRLRVIATLTDRASSQVLWSQSYDRILTGANVLDVEAEVADAIASRLAQVYGVIGASATRQLARSRPTSMFAYDCVQRAFAYRLTSDPATYWPTRACLEEAVRRDPEYAGAWAMLAYIHLSAARYDLVAPSRRAGELDAALAAAERAVQLVPESPGSQRSLSAALFARGEHDAAERVQRHALALNPHDPESLAQLGWRLMARGRWTEGERLLQEAVDCSLVEPAWYHMALAAALYLGGNLERARDEAELGRSFRTGYGPATLALTEAALGHAAAARVALDEALRQSPLLARDPVAFWANLQFVPEIIARLNAGLAKAGLTLPAPAPDPAPPS